MWQRYRQRSEEVQTSILRSFCCNIVHNNQSITIGTLEIHILDTYDLNVNIKTHCYRLEHLS